MKTRTVLTKMLNIENFIKKWKIFFLGKKEKLKFLPKFVNHSKDKHSFYIKISKKRFEFNNYNSNSKKKSTISFLKKNFKFNKIPNENYLKIKYKYKIFQ